MLDPCLPLAEAMVKQSISRRHLCGVKGIMWFLALIALTFVVLLSQKRGDRAYQSADLLRSESHARRLMETNQLLGHRREVTQAKYNAEGDLLVTCGRDGAVFLWSPDRGECIGSYKRHSGPIFQCDITKDSKLLITASSDATVRISMVETGEEIAVWKNEASCRAVAWSEDSTFVAIATDQPIEDLGRIHILRGRARCSNESQWKEPETDLIIDNISSQINQVLVRRNQLLTAHDDGSVRRWDVETGRLLQDRMLHKGIVSDLQLSADGSHLITASHDKSSKVVDADTFQTVMHYKSSFPVNSAAMFHPQDAYVLLCGGIDVTSALFGECELAGKGFETSFHDKINGKKLGIVKGHFGPVNTVASHPYGLSFCTGGRDGVVRVYQVDESLIKAVETSSIKNKDRASRDLILYLAHHALKEKMTQKLEDKPP